MVVQCFFLLPGIIPSQHKAPCPWGNVTLPTSSGIGLFLGIDAMDQPQKSLQCSHSDISFWLVNLAA